MKTSLLHVLPLAGALGAAAALSGCAGSSTNSTPTASTLLAPARPDSLNSLIRPDKCGSKTDKIAAQGGDFVVGVCGGSIGKFTYGANDAPKGAFVALKSDTTSLGDECGSPGGTIWLYLRVIEFSDEKTITFKDTTDKSDIGNKDFPAKSNFSIFGYESGNLLPGYPVKLGMPNSEGHLLFASLLNSATITTRDVYCFELQS